MSRRSSTADGAPSLAGDGGKAQWETEKLRAEVEKLRRPWIKEPASWFALATILIALSSSAIQAVNSNNAFALAEIKRERAEFEAAKADQLRKQYEEAISQADSALRKLESRRAKESAELAVLGRQLESVKAQLPATSTAAIAVREAANSLDALRDTNKQLAAQADNVSGSLEALGAKLGGEPNLPAFAVIASFPSERLARQFIDEISPRKSKFTIEVYRRDDKHYLVTLGGYLSSEEAAERVVYAKERLQSNDAYVRFAKSWGTPIYEEAPSE